MSLLEPAHPSWAVIEQSVETLCGAYRGMLCGPFHSASGHLLEDLFVGHPRVCATYGNAFDIPELTKPLSDAPSSGTGSWRDGCEASCALTVALPTMFAGKLQPAPPSTEEEVTNIAQLVLAGPVDRVARSATPSPSATKDDLHRFGFAVLAGCVATMVGLARGRRVNITRKITPTYALKFTPPQVWPFCHFEPTLRLFDLALSSLSQQQQVLIERYYVQFSDSDDGAVDEGGDHLASLSTLDRALRKLAWS